MDRLTLQKIENNDPDTVHLDFSYKKLGPKEAAQLAHALEKNEKVAFLYLLENQLGVEGAKEIANVLAKLKNLQKLNIGANRIGPEGLLAILQNIPPQLSNVNLYDNELGVEGAKILKENINKSTPIRRLKLLNNRLGAAGISEIAHIVKDPACPLTELGLRCNRIGPEGAVELFGAIAANQNSNIRVLCISNNRIGPKGAEGLADLLNKQKNIRKPVFQRKGQEEIVGLRVVQTETNHLGSEGAKSLAGALRNNTNVSHLNLRFNAIGAEGATAIAKVLATENSFLSRLNLASNDIGSEGAKNIADMLKKNSTLQQLHIGHNNIDEEGLIAIVKAITPAAEGGSASARGTGGTKSRLMKLTLAGNKLSSEVVRELANLISANSVHLRALYLERTGIKEPDGKILLEALQKNTYISSVCLDFNSELTAITRNQIVQKVGKNRSALNGQPKVPLTPKSGR